MLRQKLSIDRKLPVIVVPDDLKFYVDNQALLKQILTLYNPYDVPFNYKVFCNSPSKYIVDNSEGSLKPKCRIDILVRHAAPYSHNCESIDKFRIQIYERIPGSSVNGSILGQKDVTATLFETNEFEEEEEDAKKMETMLHKKSSDPKKSKSGTLNCSNVSNTSPFIIFAAILCMIALMLPTADDNKPKQDSFVPLYLHLTVTEKLVASYALGMLTMIILKTSNVSCYGH